MASKEPEYISFSSSSENEDDPFGMSVDHFNNMFANIQQKVQEERKEISDATKEVKKKKGKKDDEEKKSNENVKKVLTKEEKLQQVLKEREENMDDEERRLLDDLASFLNDGSPAPAPAPKTSEVPVTDLTLTDSPSPPPVASTSTSTRNRRAKPSNPKPKKKKPAPPPVLELNDSDTEEMEMSEVVPTTPTKYASIQVTWKDKAFIYSMNLYDKVSVVRKRVSKDSKVRPEDILLFYGEDILHDDKTLLETGIKRGDTLEAMEAVRKDQVATIDPAMLKLKCQSQKKREIFFIHIRKTTSLQQLKKDIAQKIGLELNEFKLQFDGEPLNLEGTPETEGLENEDCIDIYT